MKQLQLITNSRRDEMHTQWVKFHVKHPEVWTMFVQFTFDRISRGYQHYGAQTICERIRWETPLGGDGKLEFRINNNHVAFYARAFEREHPAHTGFFRFRRQISDKKPAIGLPELGPADYSGANA